VLPTLIVGRRHERRAARFLKRRGLRVLTRNLRTGRDEIDLLARDGDTVVIVEVRYRSRDRFLADLSVGRDKSARLRRAWRQIAARLALPASTSVRFDLVLASADGSMTWHKGVVG
jgi:putative endonuclease